MSGNIESRISGDNDPLESLFCRCRISWSACCSNCLACSFTVSLGSKLGLPIKSESSPWSKPESRPASLLSLNSALRSSSSHCTGSITTWRLKASYISLRCSLDGSVQLCPLPDPHPLSLPMYPPKPTSHPGDPSLNQASRRPFLEGEKFPRRSLLLWLPRVSGLLKVPSSR